MYIHLVLLYLAKLFSGQLSITSRAKNLSKNMLCACHFKDISSIKI